MTYKINVLIPAAGRGTRSGLNYPKTLFKVEGKEILLHILDLVKNFDENPTIIASPQGDLIIKKFLASQKRKSNIVIQEEPKGMGDAVLTFKKSPVFDIAENVLLIWGDIPFIRKETINQLIKAHFENNNDITLVTKKVDFAYTFVERDINKNIIKIIETRECGLKPKAGEREIGLFVFKKDIVINLLIKDNIENKYGNKSGEHGFLYIIEHMAKMGLKIEGLKIADSKELKSLNYLSDLT